MRLHDPILSKVWQALHLGGPAPPVYQRPLGRLSGEQPFYSRRVFLAPEVVRGLRRLPLTPDDEGQSLNVLAHEYAHVAQPRVFPRARFEAGASVFGQAVMPDLMHVLGFPAASPKGSLPYRHFVNRLFSDLGHDQAWRFVDRGQFGR